MPATRAADTHPGLDRQAYLTALDAAFDAAAAAAGRLSHDLQIGTRRLRLELAGDALEPMLAPLLLEPADGPADGTVRVWDDASTGTRLPPFPWTPHDIGRQGAVTGWNTPRVRAVYHGSINEPPLYGFNALSLFDVTRRAAYLWVAAPDRVPWVEHVEPLRPALHWQLAAGGHQLLHAAAVADARHAVVLAGAGFAGKTTTTMACVLAGLHFLGDNYVALELPDGAPLVHCVYPNVKLRAGSLPMLPELDRTELAAHGDRSVFDVARLRPAQLARTRDVAAVLVVRQGERTRVAPTAASDALLALAPSTVYQLPANGGAGLRHAAELLRRVPAFTLEIGPQPGTAAAAIRELLAGLP